MMRAFMNGTGDVQGNLVTRSADVIIERYRHIGNGGNWEDIPSELMTNYQDASRCHTGIYHRLEWDTPSKVIGNFRKNMLIHPQQHRGLSVREAARLQSFPDHYEFLNSIGFQQQQVADAVPPLLAEAVAESILQVDRRTSLK
jgi:DNA (cytosine-5)-methyltransferase 1